MNMYIFLCLILVLVQLGLLTGVYCLIASGNAIWSIIPLVLFVISLNKLRQIVRIGNIDRRESTLTLSKEKANESRLQSEIQEVENNVSKNNIHKTLPL
jgi:uncharacterized membrane protein